MTPELVQAWAQLAGSLTGPSLLLLAIIGLLRGDVVTRKHHEEIKEQYEARLQRQAQRNGSNTPHI